MSSTMLEATIAILMMTLIAVLVIWYLKYLAAGSEKRMMNMIDRVGLDPEMATVEDPAIKRIINDVRSHCRKCQTEGVCERWLAGEIEEENIFYPNAPLFVQLKRNTESIV